MSAEIISALAAGVISGLLAAATWTHRISARVAVLESHVNPEEIKQLRESHARLNAIMERIDKDLQSIKDKS